MAGLYSVHRPRSWERKERRLVRELKACGGWNKNEVGQITAPFIMDPTAGSLSQGKKKVCAEYQVANGIRVNLMLRAGEKSKV